MNYTNILYGFIALATAIIPSLVVLITSDKISQQTKTSFVIISFIFITLVIFVGISILSQWLKMNKTPVEQVKFEPINTIGDINEIYKKYVEKPPKSFRQYIYAGNLFSPTNDAYIKCLQQGGDAERIIFLSSIHDYLIYSRSKIHAGSKVFLFSANNNTFLPLPFPSVSIFDNDVLFSYSNNLSYIRGKPSLINRNDSQDTKGFFLKNVEELGCINAIFNFLVNSSRELAVELNAETIDNAKDILYAQNSHKYKLDVVTAISKSIAGLCGVKPPDQEKENKFLKYIGIIGSFATNCHTVYSKSSIEHNKTNDIDLLCIITDKVGHNLLQDILKTSKDIANLCSIDERITFKVDTVIAPTKATTANELKIHLIITSDDTLSIGSKFSQYDRLNNHFDLYPYINDHESQLHNLYSVSSEDLTLENLQEDKLGPKSLLGMIGSKKVSGYEYCARKKTVKPKPVELKDSELLAFANYSLKWSAINYLRCFGQDIPASSHQEVLNSLEKKTTLLNGINRSEFSNELDYIKTIIEGIVSKINNKVTINA